MYIIFITACSACGQAHFQSLALQQLQTHIWYFNILCCFMVFI